MNVGSFNEMINTFSQGVYNFTDNGNCIECGNCCSRYLVMTQKEINTISKYIEKKKIKRQIHSVNVLSGKVFDFLCPFLDDTKSNHKCTIYEVRPQICRDFKCDCWQSERKEPPLNKRLRIVDVTEQFFGDKG